MTLPIPATPLTPGMAPTAAPMDDASLVAAAFRDVLSAALGESAAPSASGRSPATGSVVDDGAGAEAAVPGLPFPKPDVADALPAAAGRMSDGDGSTGHPAPRRGSTRDRDRIEGSTRDTAPDSSAPVAMTVTPVTLAVTAADPRMVLPTERTNALELLVPEFRGRLERVVERMEREFGYTVEVIETSRSQERQDALYAQGRTTPGPVVTWTRASRHAHGLAADVTINGGWTDHAGFERLAQVAREEGLRTLGARDPGHLEMAVAPESRPAVQGRDARILPEGATSNDVLPLRAVPREVVRTRMMRQATTEGELQARRQDSPAGQRLAMSEPAVETPDPVAALFERPQLPVSHTTGASGEGERVRILPVAERGAAPVRILPAPADDLVRALPMPVEELMHALPMPAEERMHILPAPAADDLHILPIVGDTGRGYPGERIRVQPAEPDRNEAFRPLSPAAPRPATPAPVAGVAAVAPVAQVATVATVAPVATPAQPGVGASPVATRTRPTTAALRASARPTTDLQPRAWAPAVAGVLPDHPSEAALPDMVREVLADAGRDLLSRMDLASPDVPRVREPRERETLVDPWPLTDLSSTAEVLTGGVSEQELLQPIAGERTTGGTAREAAFGTSPVSRTDATERIARALRLQEAVADRPVSSVTLRLDHPEGGEDRVRIDLRGRTIGTTFDVADVRAADHLRAHTNELQHALERHGLEGERVVVRAATEVGVATAAAGERESVRAASASQGSQWQGQAGRDQRSPSREQGHPTRDHDQPPRQRRDQGAHR